MLFISHLGEKYFNMCNNAWLESVNSNEQVVIIITKEVLKTFASCCKLQFAYIFLNGK